MLTGFCFNPPLPGQFPRKLKVQKSHPAHAAVVLSTVRWYADLALLHCGVTLYSADICMSSIVMAARRLKESTHTGLVKELSRPPVHQTYAHAICSSRRCVWVCVCVCVCRYVWLWEWNSIYCQLGIFYIAQTCPLAMDRKVLKELNLDEEKKKKILIAIATQFTVPVTWHSSDHEKLTLPH